MLSIKRVTGCSMLPQFSDGDYVFLTKWPRKWLRSGQVVVVESHDYGVIIKRIDKTLQDGRFTLRGDNDLLSVTKEKMGYFTPYQLIGKVIYNFSK